MDDDNVIDWQDAKSRSAASKSKRTKRAKAARRERARGLTLCRSGRHQWEVDNSRPFDVATGKLITRRRCKHCGKSRVDLS